MVRAVCDQKGRHGFTLPGLLHNAQSQRECDMLHKNPKCSVTPAGTSSNPEYVMIQGDDFHVLNETAHRIWDAVGDGNTEEDITLGLVDEFTNEDSVEDKEKVIRQFIKSLVAKGILIET